MRIAGGKISLDLQYQRLGKMTQGEPQVADASAFYGKLIERLNRDQALPAGALANWARSARMRCRRC